MYYSTKRLNELKKKSVVVFSTFFDPKSIVSGYKK